jgi:hypothetical protein
MCLSLIEFMVHFNVNNISFQKDINYVVVKSVAGGLLRRIEGHSLQRRALVGARVRFYGLPWAFCAGFRVKWGGGDYCAPRGTR